MTKILSVVAMVLMAACYAPGDTYSGMEQASEIPEAGPDCGTGGGHDGEPDASAPEPELDAGQPDEPDVDAGTPVEPSDAGPGPKTDPVAPDEEDEASFGVEGGGCSTSGNTGGMLAVLIFAAFLLRKRPAVAAFVVASMFSVVAFAQPVDEQASFNAERFSLPVDNSAILNVDGAETAPDKTFSFYGWAGYSNDSLVLVNKDTGERAGELIGDRVGASIGIAHTVRHLTFGLELPFVPYQSRDLGTIETDKKLSGGMGSPAFIGKLQVLDVKSGSPLNLSLLARTNFASVVPNQYLGTSDFSADLGVSLGRRFGSFRLAAQTGTVLESGEQQVDDLRVSEDIYARLGAGYALNSSTELQASVAQAAEFSGAIFDEKNRNYTEAMVGVSKQFWKTQSYWKSLQESHWTAVALAGAGLNEGYGSPDFRAVLALRYQSAPVVTKPVVKKPEPVPPVIVPEPEPEPPVVTSKVIVIDDTFFEFDKQELTDSGEKNLRAIARDLNESADENTTLEVIGHTDSIGTKAYNLELGKRRAYVICAILDYFGVMAVVGTVEYGSAGEEEPRATNKTAKGRATNRRVEITVKGYEPVDHKHSDPDGSTDDGFGDLKLK